MTDTEILNYLTEQDFLVSTQDCIMKILNTSHQVIEEKYDFDTKTMTIITPDNLFSFKLNVRGHY
ncbi:hypothetical protein [Thomasclavelia cocleata]|uniref:hypothetical protein n=1 Tax=Thomasclavelia cocleata TaxID=69824 RepID=UPI00272EAABF|nr:hypothetical protein [Thomasclavelia cocleata]